MTDESDRILNEHYVPQAYLRLFAPENEGLISRYSLVEIHGGGDYYPPADRYPIKKAASHEGFADGFLETNQTNNAEKANVESIRRVVSQSDLREQDIAHLSQFIAFQQSRSPPSLLHFEGRQFLNEYLDGKTSDLEMDLDLGWRQVVQENASEGYESLQFMGWRVVENQTNVPFITSDNPVVHYFGMDFEEVNNSIIQMEGREIYCPLDPEHYLVLLDPVRFDVGPQYPDTDIKSIQIHYPREIQKFNLLQVVNAFQEIFGPVGEGPLLEKLVEILCNAFPDEDFIRGNRADIDTIRYAQYIGSGNIPKDREWYMKNGMHITTARRKKSHSLWSFNHGISMVSDLMRDEPLDGYWSDHLMS